MINTAKCVCSNTQELAVVGLQSITICLSLWGRTQMTKPCSLQYPPLHILNGGEDISETSMLISCSQILIHVLILCAWFYLHFCQPCNSFFMSPLSLSSTQNLKENKTSLWCAAYIDFCILNSIYLEDFRSWKRYFVFYLFNNSIIGGRNLKLWRYKWKQQK